MDPLLQTLALLRGGVLIALDAPGTALKLRVELPELAQRLAPGTRSLTVVLREGTRSVLEPFDAPGAPIEDAPTLAGLRLQLLYPFLPQHGAPGMQVLVTASKPVPDVHGGILRLAAREHGVFDAAGAPVLPERLTRAVADLSAERLRAHTLGGHRKALAAWVKQELTPLLQAHGFQKNGAVYVRADAEVAQLLELEISRFSTAHSLSFWIQAQIFLGDVRAEPRPGRDVLLTKAHSVWLRRTGALWGNETDAYSFGSADEFAKVTQGLSAELVGRVLPFLQQLRTAAEVLAYLQERDRVQGDGRSAYALAGALARAGRIDDARQAFSRCMSDDPTANEALRKVALSLGVTL
jgi:Domain of unknown function (DUF4304)